MAKNSVDAAAYKAEGKRRMRLRKQKRLIKYTNSIIERRNNYGHRQGEIWYENGKRMQVCSWQGTCEFPCNGDC